MDKQPNERSNDYRNLKLKTESELHRRGTVPGAPPIWEQLPHENNRQYRAFYEYLHLGPDRTIKGYARSIAERGDELDYNENVAVQLGSTYSWLARALAWDVSQEEARRDRELEEATMRGEAEPDWYIRAKIARNEDYTTAQRLSKLARQALDLHEGITRNPDGTISEHKVEPVPLKVDAKSLTGIIRLAATLRNEAIANTPKRLTGGAGDELLNELQAATQDLKELSTEQLKRLRNQQAAKVNPSQGIAPTTNEARSNLTN